MNRMEGEKRLGGSREWEEEVVFQRREEGIRGGEFIGCRPVKIKKT